jgi:tRNA dimethylallyltransferase
VDVPVICGPTAAGKSAVALWLAERWPVTIVSADSRQIYRGFDVGTAKPTAADRARVRHEGVDVADPAERYSADAWARAADVWIDAARTRRVVPLVVGGTGLYLRAAFEGLFDEPPLDPPRRAALESWLGGLDTTELRRWTEALDPPRAHLGRAQLLRAVQVALLAGERVSTLHRARARTSRWRAHYLLVDPGGPALAQRMTQRLDDMLDQGWADEVARLDRTVPVDAPAWKAAGYAAVRRLARGEQSRSETCTQILIETRQYAKRQRTWFRHQLPADGVTPLDPTAADWRDAAARWLGATEPRTAGPDA